MEVNWRGGRRGLIIYDPELLDVLGQQLAAVGEGAADSDPLESGLGRVSVERFGNVDEL